MFQKIFIIIFIFILLNTQIIFAQNNQNSESNGQNIQNNDTSIFAQNKNSANLTNIETLKDIHDIKPLENPGFNPDYLIYFLIILLILIIIGIAYYFFKKYKKGKIKIEEQIPCEPPDVIALRLLDELEKSFTQEKKYYFALSAILRGYLNNRFQIDALEKTTEELIPKISASSLEQTHKSGIKDFLLSCDPVKYAGSAVDKNKQIKDLEFVRRFVKETTEQIDNKPELDQSNK